ncbi:hypothetical protein CC78DRAFT_306761 [Lojkania enalia]|uniref:Uncharacterized protein n=1 Tax=Lojkania enalia TaxID=147567 RepID=A0A9P4N9T3_9PLEO|nr:hypothetical protein CC78DRAFT_306761 [Didymosphaeria enalia]
MLANRWVARRELLGTVCCMCMRDVMFGGVERVRLIKAPRRITGFSLQAMTRALGRDRLRRVASPRLPSPTPSASAAGLVFLYASLRTCLVFLPANAHREGDLILSLVLVIGVALR